jgi:hypothetical protein
MQPPSRDADVGLKEKHDRLRQCSRMSPEEVTLDVVGTDEFSLACQSLPRTDR